MSHVDSPISVILVEDEELVGKAYSAAIRRMGYRVTLEADLERAERCIQRQHPQILVLDVGFPGDGLGGIHLLQRLRRQGNLSPAIFLSGDSKVETVEAASRLGMVRYLEKAAGHERLRAALKEAEQVLPHPFDPDRPALDQFVGDTPAILDLKRQVQELAPFEELPVVIEGETGTGKELIARALHELGPRAAKELTLLDCTGIPGELVDSHLFGHVRGAFTGAITSRSGYFREADQGDLFMDEISEIPPTVQNKLLRVVERGELTVLGEERTLQVNVRLIAATNRSLPEMVAQGEFRADLWHRLSGLRLRIPPLRERRDDIPLLVERTLAAFADRHPDKVCVISPGAMSRLQQHNWPGNVRELEHMVKTLCVQCRGATIEGWQVDLAMPTLEDVPGTADVMSSGNVLHWREYKAKVEREYFEKLVELADGNISRAAEMAGVDRKKIYEVLKK